MVMVSGVSGGQDFSAAAKFILVSALLLSSTEEEACCAPGDARSSWGEASLCPDTGARTGVTTVLLATSAALLPSPPVPSAPC